jgi:ABC-type transport system involved in cytochrome c biogenesis permease component
MLHWVADPQWVIPNIIAPFIFTAVALTLFQGSTGPFGLYAVLGGGMMGMWGNTLYSSGFAIEFEKWQGTLEEVIATPSQLMHVIAGRSVSNALFGLVNMIAVLVIAALGFRNRKSTFVQCLAPFDVVIGVSAWLDFCFGFCSVEIGTDVD